MSNEFERSLELEIVIILGEGLSWIRIGELVVFGFFLIFNVRSGETIIGLRS